MSDRKAHIKVLKQFLKDYQEWGESLELEESVKFAINSLEVPTITLDELKEIRNKMTLSELNWCSAQVAYYLAMDILDKKISELEGDKE